MKAVLILHVMVGLGSIASLVIALLLKQKSGHIALLLLQSVCMFLTTIFSGVLLVFFGANMLHVCTSAVAFSAIYVATVYIYRTRSSS